MRKTAATGIYFGGYGWVENLTPAPARPEVAAPTGEQAPIFQTPDDPGFVHAPSLTQAATVALLRNGHLTHSTVEVRDLLAIDLSSERVRLANDLLDGVRQGQPLGALLGYRFERRLHELGLDPFIAAFRKVAPLGGKLENTNEPVEAIAANNVVDGLELRRKWDEVKDNPDASAVFLSALNPPPATAERTKLKNALNALSDAVDAVSDAVVAESVYQAVRGNTARAASTLDAIARGEAPPPELEVVRTPRSGVALTHRVVTLVSGNPAATPGWIDPAQSARASAEPHVNAFAARLLGPPANVRCVVERLDAPPGEVVAPKEITLAELRLAPLDFIYAVEGGSPSQRSEIEERILYAITRKPDGFPSGAALRVNPGRQAGWGPNDLSYGEFTEVLRTARGLITGARALDAVDLNLPERTQASGVDLAELETRANPAEQSLRQAHQSLQATAQCAHDGEPGIAAHRDVATCRLRHRQRRSAFGHRRHASRTRCPAHASRIDCERGLGANRATDGVIGRARSRGDARRGTRPPSRTDADGLWKSVRRPAALSPRATPMSWPRRLATATRFRTTIRLPSSPGFSAAPASATASRDSRHLCVTPKR